MPLTNKRKKFVAEYLIDMNGTKAAIRAGYSKKCARSQAGALLSNKAVKQLIDDAMTQRTEALKIDAEWVLKQAVELHQRCMQNVKPKMIRRGGELVHAEDDQGNRLYIFDAANAKASLDLIGKHVDVQAFKDTVTIHNQVDIAGKLLEGLRNVGQLEQADPRLINAKELESPPESDSSTDTD